MDLKQIHDKLERLRLDLLAETDIEATQTEVLGIEHDIELLHQILDEMNTVVNQIYGIASQRKYGRPVSKVRYEELVNNMASILKEIKCPTA